MTAEIVICPAAQSTVEVSQDGSPVVELSLTSIGIKGDPGPNNIGGYDVELDGEASGDVLQLLDGKWRNTPQQQLVDGGNF
jgi:hypothetical protein